MTTLNNDKNDEVEEHHDDVNVQHQQQIDEVVALSMIYPDEFRLISRRRRRSREDDEYSEEEDDDDHDHDDHYRVEAYEYPIKYSVQLSTALDLKVEYPLTYPDEPPIFTLQESDEYKDTSDISKHNLEILLETITGEIEIGMSCVLQCVQAGRDCLEEGGEGFLFAAEEVTDNKNGDSNLHNETNNNEQEEVEEEPNIEYFDTIPRPILIMIIYDYCNIKDRGRLSIASKLIRTIIERRSQRTLTQLSEEEEEEENAPNQDNDFWEQHRSMTIDGVLREGWELDVIRAKEERKIQSSHEMLWKRQHTTTFCIRSPDYASADSSDQEEGQQQQLQQRWSIREGLEKPTTRMTPTTTTTKENDRSVRYSLSLSWTSGEFTFQYARAADPISTVEHWYFVRARLSCRRPEDGDIFVGIVQEDFDSSPSSLFRMVPGGEFGFESDECALVNVISAQNSRNGHPMEVNIGLKVHGRDGRKYVDYGIPRGLHYGLPIYNNGVVRSEIKNLQSKDKRVYLAVLSATSTEQSNVHAQVTIQECSEAEWYRQIETPYNLL